MIVQKSLPTKASTQSNHNQISGGFLQVAIEFAIRNAYTLMAVGALSAVGITMMNSADSGELTGFYNQHLEVGRSSSRNTYACTQYTSSRLAGRINNNNILEVAATSAAHTAWDGSSLTYPETTFMMLDGQVTATVGCEKIPNGAVASTHSSTTVNTFPGLKVKYAGVDDSICSSLITDNGSGAWAVIGDNLVVKAYNDDSAKGLYQDGSTVCVKGDGGNTVEIYDRTTG